MAVYGEDRNNDESNIQAWVHQTARSQNDLGIIVCSGCGSDQVQRKEWRYVNTGDYAGPTEGDANDNWCGICEDHVKFVTKEKWDSEK